ncbi:speedy protein E4-like [Mesoplodon densirostris]|uniref:speedy protein E4-like n=1 Tax=Mesoplodon densirostris TaxID=48708 RepID=UPI0028DB93B1|nr:speedy protein E4-like [Mesoplodon densirostris]
MDNRQPTSQAEELNSQSSSSGYPLELTVYEESPGPSAPWAGCSPPPQRPGCKRKRSVAFRAEVEGNTAAEAQDTWVVELLSGLKMKLKRQRVSSVLPEHHEADTWVVELLSGFKMKLKRQRVSSVLPEHHKVFKWMLEDPVVKKFLAWDKNLEVSDKYLLSMVIAYVSRAGLFWQFQRIHFFIALYVASDTEENNQAPKQAIVSFLYGKNSSQHALFHKLRSQFIRSMGWKTWVTREECEQIQAFDPEFWVWGRDRTLLPQRPQDHAGLRSSACAKITEPRRDEDVQQEVNPDTDDSREEGREKPLVQIIEKKPASSRMSGGQFSCYTPRSGIVQEYRAMQLLGNYNKDESLLIGRMCVVITSRLRLFAVQRGVA